MNVQPGDMARVVGDGDGAGSIVEVISLASEEDISGVIRLFGAEVVRSIGPRWEVRLMNGARTCDQDTGRPTYSMPGDTQYARDSVLRRIEPKADDTTDEVETTAEVVA